jgi:phosphatidylserine/phosphatidylglycerophosphate/cardiolipin synthase-like enzyme
MQKNISTIFAHMILVLFLAGCGFQDQLVQAASPLEERTATIKDNQLQWAYTREGEHPEKLLVSLINSAQETLDIFIYSITLDEIVNAILDAHERGVEVRIITDGQQSENKYQKDDLRKFKAAGIPVKVDKHQGYAHIKATCVDGKILTTGSYNYSKQASTVNDEILVVIKNEKMAQAFEKTFEECWSDKKNFKDF